MPPREVPTKIAGVHVERGQHGEQIGELDLEVRNWPDRGRIGQAAAAIVERDHARGGVVVRERGRQRLEIGRGAGEAGQADDRAGRRCARP